MSCLPCHPCRWCRWSAWYLSSSLWPTSCLHLRAPTAPTWTSPCCWRGREASPCRGTSLAPQRAAHTTGSVRVSTCCVCWKSVFILQRITGTSSFPKQSGRWWPQQGLPLWCLGCMKCCQESPGFEVEWNFWKTNLMGNSQDWNFKHWYAVETTDRVCASPRSVW